ncbi:POTRA domain-containing protein, partial [Klebsiella pneumoniae]|uniref:POTRA domain-containing protein n=1 Tax=Klebsiella pneumoniae TaxID=573 RepID=UPI003968545B
SDGRGLPARALATSALASPRELAMSFPGRTGELLDLRELEQLVDQLGRLPSRQAQLELVPGSEVGGSRGGLGVCGGTLI